MTQDKAPEWAIREAMRITLVPNATHPSNVRAALALSRAYDRGQESMRERAAGVVESKAVEYERETYMSSGNSIADRQLSRAISVRLMGSVAAIRSLPIEQEGEQ